MGLDSGFAHVEVKLGYFPVFEYKEIEDRNENNKVRFTAHDIRFTVKENTLYAICLGRPGDQITIRSLAINEFLKQMYDTDIKQITLLGNDKPLKWKLSDEGLIIDVPEKMSCEHAYTFKIVH